MKSLTRGVVAKQAGLGIETIRFYEQKGLIPLPSRSESGYRQYSADIIRRLEFIQRAKDLGFSLKEITDLLSLRVDPKTTCSNVKQRTEAKIAEVTRKISELQRIRKALNRLVKSCRGKGPRTDCPILDALETKESRDATR